MFKEKDLDLLCESLNLDSQFIVNKRKYTLFGSLILAAVSLIYWQNLLISSLIVIIGFVIVKFEYWDIKNRFRQKAAISQLSFISFFGYLMVFLENNFNLYQSVKTALEYVDETIKPYVETLLKEIDRDKSITPYVNFSLKFSSQLVGQISLMLYQLENSGYDASLLDKFGPLIEKLRSQTMDEYIQDQSTKLDVFGIFPLAATVIVSFALVIGILQSLAVIISG